MRLAMPFRAHADTRWLAAAAGTACLLAACAVVVKRQTAKAERDFPPKGRFVTVDGVRLHFTVHGRDDAPQTVVLLHGNRSLADEFDISGLTRQAADRYRVVIFDRPGYGYSERPDGRRWGPEEQADLIHAALTRLGVAGPVVFGHSWGALVALAMGLRCPQDVGSLVLASGYYFPRLLGAPALPGIGALLRHTISPLLNRLLWPVMVRRMFAPARSTPAFRERFPVWMSLRPKQLQASASESAMMIPAAASLRRRYEQLEVPAVLVAGAKDRQLSTRWHSGRLHDRLDRSWLRVIEGSGHMVHHVATGQVMAAIDQAAAIVWDRSLLLRPSAGLKAGDNRMPAPRPMPFIPCATAAPQRQFDSLSRSRDRAG